MQLSSQILKYRKAAHLTQEQLAAELGVTPQAVSNWERGGAPDIGMLPMIANNFRITIDELMGNDTENIQNEKNEFWNQLRFTNGEERIVKLTEYRKKFPHDVFAMRHIIDTICELPKDKQEKYILQAEMLCEKILDECNDPDLRNSAVYNMCMLCSRDDREKWLTFLPQYNRYQRQNVNKLLLCEDGDFYEAALQSAVIRYSRMADFCDTGIPISAVRKRKSAGRDRFCAFLMEFLRTEFSRKPGWAYMRISVSYCLRHILEAVIRMMAGCGLMRLSKSFADGLIYPIQHSLHPVFMAFA